jgi:hypothetical protein
MSLSEEENEESKEYEPKSVRPQKSKIEKTRCRGILSIKVK